MGAFIFSGVIFFGTLVVCGLIIGADMMSDSPGSSINPAPVFYGGMILSGLILASHWMPSIGW